jgi:MFS family permease
VADDRGAARLRRGATALVALADGPELAIPLRFVTGFFLAGVYPPAFKLMSTWFVRGRAFALGTLAGALAIGSGSPHLVNALGGLDWRVVVYATSVMTVAGGVVAWRFVPEGPFPFPPAVFDLKQIGLVLRNRGVRLASFGYFGHMWELFAVWAWFLVFVREGHGLDGTAAALATFAFFLTGGLGCVLGGLAAERVGRAEAAAAALGASCVCALGIGLLLDAPTWLLLAVGLFWGVVVIADSALFSTLVTEHADQSYVGTALALQLALGFALTTATIWLMPYLEDAVGWRWAFAFLAPGPALGVLAMLRLSRA